MYDNHETEGRPLTIASPRILLVIGGGIAAYKSCELVRLIRRAGGEVTCVLTQGGAQFVTPMALAALSGRQVHTTLWDLKDEAEIGHIQLSRQADLVVVCPATANLLAKMATGIADDLASTLILATDKPVLCVPAMNVRMWQHEATERNVAMLRMSGVRVMEPALGEMACGEFGPGRLPEPETVWIEIAGALGIDPGPIARTKGWEHEDEEGEESDPGHDHPGALGAMLAALIPRAPRHDPDGAPAGGNGEDGGGAGGVGRDHADGLAGDPGIGPDLPEPDPTRAPFLLASKGRAKAAPPTDREAINHLVNARQQAPQPFDGEEAAAPVNPLRPDACGRKIALPPHEEALDPLAGQPGFSGPVEERPLFGKHVLVTAGPTHEPIDPVRYLANRSSGRQGFAIAAAAAAAGARVTLVAGPVNLATPPGVDRIDVESAEDMARAVKEALPADAAVMVAAVADWRPRDVASEKMKKRNSAPPAIILTENPDILASIAASPRRPDLLIGFAAETENVVENARRKRKSKGVDWIVANDVSGGPGKSVMGGAHNQVHLILEGQCEDWEPMSKQDVAMRLVMKMAQKLCAHV